MVRTIIRSFMPSGERWPGVLAVLAAGVLAGCGDPGGAGESTGIQPPARWSLEPEVTYRVPDTLGLSSVPDLAVASDGRVYVLAAELHHVLVFSPDGELDGMAGREGEGPGEFTDPRRVGVVGDTVWVADAGQNRLVLFRRRDLSPVAALTPLSSIRAELGRNMPLGLFPSGDPFYLSYRQRSPESGSARGFEGRYVRLDGGDTAPRIDTILVHRTRCESLALAFGDGRGTTYLDNHLCDDAVVASDGRTGRLVVVERPFPPAAESAAYRVEAIGAGGEKASGEPLWSTAVPFRPIPVSPELWDFWMEDVDGQITMLIERLNAFPSKAAAREALEEAVPARPDHLPPVPLLNAGPLGRPEAFVAGNGWVWIQRWTALRELGGDHREWDVLDAGGQWRARVVAPEPVVIHDATETHAWGVQRDDLGVPRIVRFRIEKGPGPDQ